MSRKRKTPKRIFYSTQLAIDICARILTRDELGNLRTLRDVCNDDGMPAESTAYHWMNLHAEFAEMYARAREERAHMVADEIVQIADTELDPNRARIRIDARKWWAGKANAKHYGERASLDVNLKRDATTMTDHELELIAARGRTGAAEKADGSATTH
jgi:hypothetical protein